MKYPTVIFSHGQESGPWGTKIRSMSDMARHLGCQTDSIDYRGMVDPDERAGRLVEACRSIDKPLLLVGSSMGGHVATAAATESAALGLFVLAPAYYIPGYDTPAPPPIPVEIVHGWRDDVVPPENSIRFAREYNATLHLVDGDHRLTDNIGQINYYLERFIRNAAGR